MKKLSQQLSVVSRQLSAVSRQLAAVVGMVFQSSIVNRQSSILLAFCLPLSAFPAITVTNTIVDRTGQPAARVPVTFTAASTQRPLMVSGQVRPGWVVRTNADSTGYLCITLLAGDYTVQPGTDATDAFTISVPSGTNTVDLVSLATTPKKYLYVNPPLVLRTGTGINVTTNADLDWTLSLATGGMGVLTNNQSGVTLGSLTNAGTTAFDGSQRLYYWGVAGSEKTSFEIHAQSNTNSTEEYLGIRRIGYSADSPPFKPYPDSLRVYDADKLAARFLRIWRYDEDDDYTINPTNYIALSLSEGLRFQLNVQPGSTNPITAYYNESGIGYDYQAGEGPETIISLPGKSFRYAWSFPDGISGNGSGLTNIPASAITSAPWLTDDLSGRVIFGEGATVTLGAGSKLELTDGTPFIFDAPLTGAFYGTFTGPITGTLTNNTSGRASYATNAGGGWPTSWPMSAISNAAWQPSSANLSNWATLSTNVLASSGGGSSSNRVSYATNAGVAAFVSGVLTNNISGSAAYADGAAYASTASWADNISWQTIQNAADGEANPSLGVASVFADTFTAAQSPGFTGDGGGLTNVLASKANNLHVTNTLTIGGAYQAALTSSSAGLSIDQPVTATSYTVGSGGPSITASGAVLSLRTNVLVGSNSVTIAAGSANTLVATNGRVGVGSAQPLVALDVGGQIAARSATFPPLSAVRAATSSAIWGGMSVGATNTAGVGSTGFGILNYFTLEGTASDMNYAGTFGAYWTDANTNSALVFSPAYNGVDPFTRRDFTLTAVSANTANASFSGSVVITNTLSTSNLIVGTTYPTLLTSDSTGLVTDQPLTVGGVTPSVTIGAGGPSITATGSRLTANTVLNVWTNSLQFGTPGSAWMTITNGKVGINKVNTIYDLEVNGTFVVGGYIFSPYYTASTYYSAGTYVSLGNNAVRLYAGGGGLAVRDSTGTNGAALNALSAVITNTLTASNIVAENFSFILTNGTSSNSVLGMLVEMNSASNDCYQAVAIDSQTPIGVVLDAGVAPGGPVRICSQGKALVLVDDQSTTNWPGSWLGTSATIAGRAKIIANPANTAEHDKEIGHGRWKESYTASGSVTNLRAVVLQFGR